MITGKVHPTRPIHRFQALLRAEGGNPVIFRSGSLKVDTPAAWALGCLILWIFFFPLYLANRH
jgi:hypothetical protein